jgi:hypothetical protein
MRHFLIQKVGEPIAIARLPDGLEPSAATLGSVSNSCPAHRVSPLLEAARLTEATTSITSSAEKKLNTASGAVSDAIGL